MMGHVFVHQDLKVKKVVMRYVMKEHLEQDVKESVTVIIMVNVIQKLEHVNVIQDGGEKIVTNLVLMDFLELNVKNVVIVEVMKILIQIL